MIQTFFVGKTRMSSPVITRNFLGVKVKYTVFVAQILELNHAPLTWTCRKIIFTSSSSMEHDEFNWLWVSWIRFFSSS